MTPQDWNDANARALTVAFSGDTGDPARPDDPFLIINSWWEPLDFAVPDSLRDLGWQVEIDTADPAASGRGIDPSAGITLTGLSLMLLHGKRT